MTTNLTSTEHKMLLWSFDFIKHHQDDTTEQIPDELIKFWSIPNFTAESNYNAGNVHIIIFMYILKLHQCPLNKADDFLNTFRFKQLFYNFQVILATTTYCREAGIKVEPFQIFNISRYTLPDLSNRNELLKMYESVTDCHIIQQ